MIGAAYTSANKIMQGMVNRKIHIFLFFVFIFSPHKNSLSPKLYQVTGLLHYSRFFAAASDSFVQNSSAVMFPYASSGSSVENVSIVF